jgi:uncharacterized protein
MQDVTRTDGHDAASGYVAAHAGDRRMGCEDDTMKVPQHAAWRHVDAREGVEVVFIGEDGAGYRLEGHTVAVEDGQPWAVRYSVTVDTSWRTRTAAVQALTATGEHACSISADGSGHWLVDGMSAPALDGCLDVDLEASACTNTLAIHRLALVVGDASEAPAAYVRVGEPEVERLDQTYVRLPDAAGLQRYDYSAPSFDFAAVLSFDLAGLIVDYPGIATRIA